MKLKKSLFISLLTVLIVGCSDHPENKLSYTDVDTIKEIVLNRETDVTWTKEIEGDVLNQTFPHASVSPEVSYNVEAVQVLPDYKKSVYPSFNDFGSLDTSAFDENQKKNCNDFCEALANNIFTGPEAFFQPKYAFNYFFFKKELQEKWKDNFDTDFPVKPEDFNTDGSEKSEKTDETEKSEEKKLDPIFTNWIVGEPFLGDSLGEIPVRFFTPNGTIDVTIYMNPKSENSIYQITIDRWGKSDGRE